MSERKIGPKEQQLLDLKARKYGHLKSARKPTLAALRTDVAKVATVKKKAKPRKQPKPKKESVT